MHSSEKKSCDIRINHLFFGYQLALDSDVSNSQLMNFQVHFEKAIHFSKHLD